MLELKAYKGHQKNFHPLDEYYDAEKKVDLIRIALDRSTESKKSFKIINHVDYDKITVTKVNPEQLKPNTKGQYKLELRGHYDGLTTYSVYVECGISSEVDNVDIYTVKTIIKSNYEDDVHVLITGTIDELTSYLKCGEVLRSWFDGISTGLYLDPVMKLKYFQYDVDRVYN